MVKLFARYSAPIRRVFALPARMRASADATNTSLSKLTSVAATVIGVLVFDQFWNARADNTPQPVSCETRPPTEARSEERRVGKECVSTGRSRWSRDH